MMKTNFLLIIGWIVLLFIASCKNTAQKEAEDYMNKIEKTVKENSPPNTDDIQKPKTGSPNIPQGMENILGEWELVVILRDDNGNHKIDKDEEKTGIENTGYMKLNADGTCKFQTVMDGTYEIVNEGDGRKKLVIHDMAGTKYPGSLYINSVNENELVINTVYGGSNFEIYTRP